MGLTVVSTSVVVDFHLNPYVHPMTGLHQDVPNHIMLSYHISTILASNRMVAKVVKCSSGFGLHSSPHLSQAAEIFNSLVSPADAVSVGPLLTSPVSQNSLSGKLDDHVFNLLLNLSSVAGKARLLLVSSPHVASWLLVVPFESLGLHMDPLVFQVAIKWWLGLDISCRGLPVCTVPRCNKEEVNAGDEWWDNDRHPRPPLLRLS